MTVTVLLFYFPDHIPRTLDCRSEDFPTLSQQQPLTSSLSGKLLLFYQFQITPRLPGRLALSVYDICLDSERPAMADVKLADIHTIQVIVADKVTSACHRRSRLLCTDTVMICYNVVTVQEHLHFFGSKFFYKIVSDLQDSVGER